MNRTGGRLTPTQRYGTRRTSPSFAMHPATETTLGHRGIVSPPTQDPGAGEPPSNKLLVRYITETLIKKIAKEESLDQILSLNLTLSKEGGKKIKYIENLDGLKRLQVLSLSCNIIEKIEKLDKLTKLKELNLSFNCITRLDGLEPLIHLQVLNLTGNRIEHIPVWFGKKLKELRTLRIAKNKLGTLQELARLRPLHDLVQLNIADNPLCELPHARLFMVFQLRTLEILDGTSVDFKERQIALERFEQEEIENLEDQLEKQEKKFQSMEDEKSKTLMEIKQKGDVLDDLKKRDRDHRKQLKELQRQLETKDELLKRKTVELNRACEKHYKLEQELAFYKIDAKFDSLGQFPAYAQAMEDESGGAEESPYLGKARYKQSSFAGQKFIMSKAQPVTVQKLSYDEPDTSNVNAQVKDRIHQALDIQLVNKEENIEKAQDKLRKLQDELQNTEHQLLEATQELQRIASATPQRPLTEEDKQQIRNRLAKKMRAVNQLRVRAAEIEGEMQTTKQYMQREEKAIQDLQVEMERLGEDHPQYANVKAQVANRKQQLRLASDQYEALQRELEEMLARIEKETAEIRKLEQQLQEGKAAANEELKEELEGIVESLTEYLNNVKQQALKQRDDYEDLRREKEQLMAQLHDLEAERSMIRFEAEQNKELQRKINDLERSFSEAQTENAALRQSQTELSKRLDPDTEARLRAAAEEAEKYRAALEEEQRKAQAEREAMHSQLMREQERVDLALSEAKVMTEKEEEGRRLAMQVAALQATNESLKNRLREQQDQIDEVMNNSMRPEDVVKRLHEMSVHMDDGGDIVPYSDRDILGKTLSDLQSQLQEKLRQSMKDKEQAKKRQEQAEAEIKQMRDTLKKAEQQFKQATEKALQAKLAEQKKAHESNLLHMQQDMRKLSDKIKEAERRAAEERERQRQEMEASRNKPSSPERSPAKAEGSDEKKPTPIKVVPDPKDREKIKELEKALMESKKREKSIDKNSSKKLSEAEAQIARLEGELRRRQSRDDEDKKKKDKDKEKEKQRERELAKERERKEKAKQAEKLNAEKKELERRKQEREEKQRETERQKKVSEEQYSHPQARRAARGLAKAQEEIEKLQALLIDKEKELEVEIQETDRASQTVAAQQEEISNLYERLEDQQMEIKRLREMLDHYDSPRDTDDDPEMAALVDEIEALKDALYQQGSEVEEIITPRGPSTRRVHYGDVVDEYQYTPPSSSWPPQERSTPLSAPPPPAEYYPVDDGRYYSSPYGSPGRYYPRPDNRGYPEERGQAGPQPVPVYGSPYPHRPQSQPPPPPPGPDFDMSTSMPYQPPAPPPPMAPPAAAANISSVAAPPAAGGGMYAAAASAAPQPAVFVQAPSASTMAANPATVTAPIPTPAAATTAAAAPATRLATAPQVILTSTEQLQQHQALPRQIELPADMLFCNVPEHHDLEDEVARLHKLIEKQKKKDKRRRRFSPGSTDSLVYDRLEEALEEKREELDALDLAVERQRANLRRLKDEDAELKRDKDDTLHELQRLKRTKNKDREELKSSREKEKKRREFLAGKSSHQEEEEDYTDEVSSEAPLAGRKKSDVMEEIHCLEKTLSKRRAELREADRLLFECKSDLNVAKEKARETIKRYDDAAEKLTITQQDAEEIEKRAQETAEHLVRAEEELANLKLDVQEMEQVKIKREDEIREINRIISSRNADYGDVDQRTAQTTSGRRRRRLDRFQADLLLGDDRDSRQQHGDVEDINHEIGQRKMELQHLLESVEKKKAELTAVLREGDTDVSKKQRDIKKVQNALEELSTQRDELDLAVSEKKTQLIKLRDSTEQEDETLQHLISNVNKHKTELKHVLEMLQLEKTELEALKQQHNEKMSTLEKTQHAVIEEKAELEKLETEAQRKRTELEQTKHIVEKEKADSERLSAERKLIHDNIQTLTKEKELLDSNCNSLENKISHLKKKQTDVEDDIHRAQTKLGKMGQDITQMEKELEETANQKMSVQKDVQQLKQLIKESKNELKGVKRQISEAQEQKYNLEQELRDAVKRKSETAGELDRVRAMIDKSKENLNECVMQENKKQEELHGLLKEIDESSLQLDERKRALQRLHSEIEREEIKQNRLIENLNVELETVNADIQGKRDELDQTTAKLHNVKRDMEKLELTKEKYESLEDKVGLLGDQIASLEKALKDRDEEKSQLAETLNFTHNEIQTLRKDKQECERQIAELKMELTSAKEQLQKACTDFDLERKDLTGEIQNLETTAHDHCTRANRLSEELNSIRQEYVQVKNQLRSQADFDDREQRLQGSIKALKADIKNEVQEGLKDLEMSRMEVVDELEQLHSQKEKLHMQLDIYHQNLKASRLEHLPERDTDPQRPHTNSFGELSWRSEAMHEKLTQEQDQLKLKLRQHFSNKAGILEDVRRKSESTLRNLKKKLENLEDLVTSNARSYSSMSSAGRLDGMNGISEIKDSDYFSRSEVGLKSSLISLGKSTGSRNGDHYSGLNGTEDRTRSWSTSSASELVMPSFHGSQSQENGVGHLPLDTTGSPSTSPSSRRRGYAAKRPTRSRSAERLSGSSPITTEHLDVRVNGHGQFDRNNSSHDDEHQLGKASDLRMKQFMDSVHSIGGKMEDIESRMNGGENYGSNAPEH
ncbi:centriolin-like isoform X2 [Ptychodera flava]|uniref:centriolin-like isoform X2 n=1 Tax=Ptychodera flava TaxID=63121 RepID=UPI00396A79D8